MVGVVCFNIHEDSELKYMDTVVLPDCGDVWLFGFLAFRLLSSEASAVWTMDYSIV